MKSQVPLDQPIPLIYFLFFFVGILIKIFSRPSNSKAQKDKLFRSEAVLGNF